MSKSKPFFGSQIVDHVALYALFPGSPIEIIAPAEFDEGWPLIVAGPQFQIEFLYSYLLEVVRKSPISKEEGNWQGIYRVSEEQANLFYRRGDLLGRLRLIEERFRRDLVLYANLRISEKSVLEIFHGRLGVVERITIDLPEGVQNGDIEVPRFAWIN